jgi:hypothetical protein
MLDTSKYMNKKSFADSLGFTRTTFERRSIDIDFVLPGGLLSEEIREEWRKKLKEWERLQVEIKQNKKRGSK